MFESSSHLKRNDKVVALIKNKTKRNHRIFYFCQKCCPRGTAGSKRK